MTGELFVIQKGLDGKLIIRYRIGKTWYTQQVHDGDEICVGPEIRESRFIEGTVAAWTQPVDVDRQKRERLAK